MQLRIWISAAIFVGSYLPLSLILMIKNFDANAWRGSCCSLATGSFGCLLAFKTPLAAYGFTILSLVCFCITLAILRVVRPVHPIDIHQSKHIPTDLINYTFPYIVSFMAVDYTDVLSSVTFLVFVVWLFVINQRSGRIIYNPLLIVFGWRLYELNYAHVGDPQIRTGVALCNGEIEPGATYKKTQLDDVQIIKF